MRCEQVDFVFSTLSLLLVPPPPLTRQLQLPSCEGDAYEDGEMVMIPRAALTGAHSLRGGMQGVYTTTPSQFPYGWKLASVPLKGQQFTDATPVFFKGRWYVWVTTVESTTEGAKYELQLYVIEGTRLATAAWVRHPSSPITSDMRYARSGGRPVVHQQKLLRPAKVFPQTYLDNKSTYMHTYSNLRAYIRTCMYVCTHMNTCIHT